MQSLELNKKTIKLLLKAVDILEGSEGTTFEEDRLCRDIEDELETKLCNIHMKESSV
jgi:hypothetical protein